MEISADGHETTDEVERVVNEAEGGDGHRAGH